jgi:hypothetical protein
VTTEVGAHTLALERKKDKVYAFLPQSHRAAVFQEIFEGGDPNHASSRLQRSKNPVEGASKRLMMKSTLIAIGLLAILVQASPAFARAGGLHAENPWNPEHIDGLPSEVRHVLTQMCRRPRAEHQFASYFQNSRFLVLHFEHWRCGDRGPLCTAKGCLHHVYISTGDHYRLLRSYYGPAGD